jgi:hypothetical protein
MEQMRTFVECAVKSDPSLLRLMPDDLIDHNVVLDAFPTDAPDLSILSSKMINDWSLMWKLTKKIPTIYPQLPAMYRANNEFMILAIRSHITLLDSSPVMCTDKRTALIGAELWSASIMPYISTELQCDKDIVTAALLSSQNPYVDFRYLTYGVECDCEFISHLLDIGAVTQDLLDLCQDTESDTNSIYDLDLDLDLDVDDEGQIAD